jgi:hypothetical protein
MPLVEDTWRQLKLRKAIGKTLGVMYSSVLLLSMQSQRRGHVSSHVDMDAYNNKNTTTTSSSSSSDLVFTYGVGGRLVALEDASSSVAPWQYSQRRQGKPPYTVLVNVKVLADSPLGASRLADSVVQVRMHLVCVPYCFTALGFMLLACACGGLLCVLRYGQDDKTCIASFRVPHATCGSCR